MTINRAEFAVFIGPFVPDADTVVLQILDIRIPGEEPQKLVDYGLEMDFLRSKKRKAILEIEAHLITEDTLRPSSGAVFFQDAVLTDMSE